MIQLSLRPTVIARETRENDYRVMFEGRRVGRIREATERSGFNPCWTGAINPPLPIPTWGTGQVPSFEDAKAAFRETWERFYASLTPHDIQHWHHHQDAAAERSRAS